MADEIKGSDIVTVVLARWEVEEILRALAVHKSRNISTDSLRLLLKIEAQVRVF